MYVVLDSNIWLAERLLRLSTGSAFRFFLRNRGARLVVPEVVRREVQIHLEKELVDLSDKIRDNFVALLALIGELKEVVPPTIEQINRAVNGAFDAIGVETVDVPFSLDSARASFEKCLRSEAPSGPHNQQFKDGVIWHDCCRLAADDAVILVTGDKAFFRDRDPKKGIAPNLMAEAEATAYGITVYYQLQDVLEKVRADIPISYDSIEVSFLPTIRSSVEVLLEREGFQLGSRINASHSLFATEDPSRLHIEFQLIYRCVHPDGREGTLTASGEGVLVELTSLEDVRTRGEVFEYLDIEGTKQTRHVLVGVASIVMGHRSVQHVVRVQI